MPIYCKDTDKIDKLFFVCACAMLTPIFGILFYKIVK